MRDGLVEAAAPVDAENAPHRGLDRAQNARPTAPTSLIHLTAEVKNA